MEPGRRRSAPVKRRRTRFLFATLACVASPGLAGAPAGTDTGLQFGAQPSRWVHQPLSRLKRDTVYAVVSEGGRSVLRADADRSASLYVAKLDPLAAGAATICWEWKADAPVAGADPREPSQEDAPLRVLVAFDGDVSTLPDTERQRFERVKSLSGQSPPYAVVMYVWNDQVPVETVVPSAHTSRLKMLIAGSGTDGIGRWQSVRRDLAADYRRLFGTAPGPVLGVAVMTDTDNTGTRAVGRYADVRLGCAAD
jgi:hypothetical protein